MPPGRPQGAVRRPSRLASCRDPTDCAAVDALNRQPSAVKCSTASTGLAGTRTLHSTAESAPKPAAESDAHWGQADEGTRTPDPFITSATWAVWREPVRQRF